MKLLRCHTLRAAVAAVLSAIMLTAISACDQKEETVTTTATAANDKTSTTTATSPLSFANPKKSAHYESNTPSHASVLAGVPINVVINFNFDLAPPSTISVQKDGKEYGRGETVIDDNKLAMRRALDPAAPGGLYTVSYNACWPDGSCHDGSFQFAIDRSQAAGFTDQRGRPEVAVTMTDTSFQPANIIVSKGTKVVS